MRTSRLLVVLASLSLGALAGCPPPRPPYNPCDEDACREGSVGVDTVFEPDVLDAGVDAPDAFDASDASDVVANPCELDGTYSYGFQGGLSAYTEQSALSPARSYTRRRTFADPMTPPIECTNEIPACAAPGDDAGDELTVADVVAAIADPDVQRALGERDDAGGLLVYGVDARPMDGQVFAFMTADGRGFYVGEPCMGAPDCREVPEGLAVLAGLLTALDRQQLAGPECAMLR